MSNIDIKNDDGEAFVRKQMQMLEEIEEKLFENPEVPGFTAGKDGIFAVSEDSKGNERFTWLGELIHVPALSRDIHGEAWGKLLEITDADGRRKTWVMPADVLSSSKAEWHQTLTSLGWSGDFAYAKKLGCYLARLKPKRRILSVKRTGWNEDGEGNKFFVMPDCIYGQNGGEEIQLQASAEARKLYGSSGTLEEWQDLAKLAEGNSRFAFALCAALSGPMLHRIPGAESGGFNFLGSTSSGKSIMLKFAATVWDDKDFVLSWKTTDNGLEGKAEMRNDSVILLDEIGQATPNALNNIIYMLGNGRGKIRATRNGETRAVAAWRLMILSNGEYGLKRALEKGGITVQPGQEVRLADIPADAGKGMRSFENIHGRETPQAFAIEIEDRTGKTYGTAGRAFLEAITEDPEADQWIIEKMESFTAEIPQEAESEIKRVGKRFALCCAVGEYAIMRGILPFQVGEAYSAAKTCFNAWITERGGMGKRDSMTAVEVVSQFIEQHGGARFQDVREDEDGKSPFNRAGFRGKTKTGQTEYLFLPQTFESEVLKGLGKKTACESLEAAGMLKRDGKGHYTTKRTVPELGRIRCYAVSVPQEEDTPAPVEDSTPF